MSKKQGIKAYINERFTAISAVGSILTAGAVASATAPSLGIGGLAIGALTGVGTMLFSNVRHHQIRNNEAYSAISGETDLNALLAIANGEATNLLELEAPTQESNKKSYLLSLQSTIADVQRKQAILGDLLTPVTHLLALCQEILAMDDPFDKMNSDEFRFKVMLEEELPTTFETFYNSSEPATNKKNRQEFYQQIKLLTAYVEDILKFTGSIKDDQLTTQGHYLDSKYGSFLTSDSNAE